MGSIATADTLYAMDEPIQTGTEDWAGLAPMARLLSAGDLLVEYDQAYEHYGTPQPQLLAQDLQPTPAGPVATRSPSAPRSPTWPSVPTLDEQDLAAPPNLPWPSPLVTYTVTDPRPIIRAESDGGALVVAGDATGLQDLADAGHARHHQRHLLRRHPRHPPRPAGRPAEGRGRPGGDRHQPQAGLPVGHAHRQRRRTPRRPAPGPGRLDTERRPHRPLPRRTARRPDRRHLRRAPSNVTASSYGNAISYTPEDRAYNAVDGDLDTAWETGTFVPDPVGPVVADPATRTRSTTGQITLTQPVTGDLTRWITRATLTFDGGRPVTVDLGPPRAAVGGQTFDLPGPDVLDAAHHHRRHQRRPRQADHSCGRGIRRGRRPRPARGRGHQDARRPPLGGRGRLASTTG